VKVSLRLLASALCLTFLAGASLAFGATPLLVRDIDPHPSQEQGGAEQLVSVGDRAVFFLGPDNAPDHARLRELWTTDGTASGTERLRSFSDDLRSLGSNGRIAFFAVQSADFVSWQLWRTDGTATGTFSFNVTVPTPYLPSIRTFYQNRLLFDGCTPQGGCELWASDGTAAGTRQVRDLTPGPASSRPHGFASAGGRLYFFADDPSGLALWTSDGSSDGTHRVITLPPFSRPMNPVVAGDRIFFLEGVPFHSTLWTSDGTAAGTRTVPPFDHAGNRRPEVDSILGSLGGSLFFAGLDRFNSYQLWKTDGTPRGTLRLTSSPRVPPGVNLLPTGGAALGDRFVFKGVDFHLWTTRGTPASTQRLTGCPGGCPLAFAVSLVHDGKLFFTGSTPDSGSEPWVTDGTAAGTRRLGDFCPGSCGSDPNFVAVVLGRAFFLEGPRLWATDGTAAGAALLNDGGFLGQLAAAGDRIVFAIFSEGSGPGLAVTDGTAAGTQTLDVHFSHGAGSNPRLFLPIGNEVRFQTCDTAPAQVWTSDGTAGGTLPLNGETVSSYCAPLARLGSSVYFIGVDPDQSFEVWRSDGAPGGAFPITRLAPDRTVMSLGAAGDRLAIFIQSATPAGTELWTSDGTAAGTVKVTDLPDRAPGFVAASPGGRPGEFFFQATDAEGVNTFWFSDGTAGGTRRLIGFFSPDPTFTGFTRFNGAVYFSPGGGGLWKTDGTAAGTRQVLQDTIPEIVPFAGSLFLFDQSAQILLRSDGSAAGTNFIANLSDAQSLNPVDPRPTAAGGVLYFAGIDAEHGAELWRTDGTRAGSRIVADISPGAGSSSPAELTAAGGLLYFTANDGEHGRELWVTDGTGAGTRMVADLAAGPGSSSPMELTVAGDHLFFNADDGFTGRELWLLPLGPNN
jgi:ELWxxDGT repeat protein